MRHRRYLVALSLVCIACSGESSTDAGGGGGGAGGEAGTSSNTGGSGGVPSGGDAGTAGSSDGGSPSGGTGMGGVGAVGGSGGMGGGGAASGGDGGSPPEPQAPTCDGTQAATDASGTTPGDASLPFPTLRHLSVVWAIDGDDNENGRVAVRYRPEGGSWRTGTPLRRVPAGDVEGFSWVNKHSGTLFGLEPGTTYEVELYLSDPDGGCEIRTLTATTRTVPEAPPGAPIASATPATFDGALAALGPGDVLELETGTYSGFTVDTSGSPGAPIVVRAAGDVTVDGDVRIDGQAHVIVEGLTVNGQIKFNAGEFIAIKGCTVNANVDGIAMLTRGENAYIADNVVTGQTSWTETALGVDGDNIGEGIVVTGPGHVIEHNRVSGFRDAISFLEDSGAVDQYSLDVIGNEISEAADDGVEADFCFENCRIIENRLTNTFMAPSPG